jgi:hypothetical protein
MDEPEPGKIALSSPLLDETDVKVVYDSQGNKREVLIDYDKYQAMLEFIERHSYYCCAAVQERLRKSDEDVRAGRCMEFCGDEVDKALRWLDE